MSGQIRVEDWMVLTSRTSCKRHLMQLFVPDSLRCTGQDRKPPVESGGQDTEQRPIHT